MSTLASSRVQKSAATEPQAFSIRQARLIIGDLFVRRPGVYTADLLITLAIGYPCVSYFMMPGWHWTQVLAFIVGGLALFRAGSFIHEIVHMGQGTMTRFKVLWNLCCGIPMLMPSFLYECHIDHHAVPHYGTGRAGEYLPLGRGPLRRLFGYLLQIAVLPALAFFRFFLLTPISFLHPKLRRWVLENASSYVMNPEYKRELQAGQPHVWWAWADVACCLRAWAMFLVPVLGLAPFSRWGCLYLIAMYVIGLNWTRNLVAHHYRNDGTPMSHEEQLTDSINITGHPLWTELLFPLGLRYHALHHLFPGVPYHNLGKAHRRLVAELPQGSPYHSTIRPSFFVALRELWHDAKTGGQAA